MTSGTRPTFYPLFLKCLPLYSLAVTAAALLFLPSRVQAEEITFEFSFDLTTAIAPLSVGDTVTGSLTYDDTVAFVAASNDFPNAITSLTLSTGGASGTFAGTDFDFNSVGPQPSFFTAQFFSPNLSSDLPFDLANFGIGFPQDPLPGSFVPTDLTTFVNIFPNTFTFQFTYDGNIDISEGFGVATVVPEPNSFILALLLAVPFCQRRLRR